MELTTRAFWLLAWAALARRWKHRQVDFAKPFAATLVPVAAGRAGTVPPFFELFR